jgi:hypothetical protein
MAAIYKQINMLIIFTNCYVSCLARNALNTGVSLPQKY